MQYHRVYVESIGYELPPVVVTTTELEARLGCSIRALFATGSPPVDEIEPLPRGRME